MTNYEIFELVFGDFNDKFEQDYLIFTQKYVVGHHQIFIYSLKAKKKVDVVACLDFLKGLQEKFVYCSSWSPFCFNYFDGNDDIRFYRLFCKNEDEKCMYERFCDLSIF